MKIALALLVATGTTVCSVLAQTPGIPRDTSFTTVGAFLKEKKHFPFIEIAKATLQAGIRTNAGVVYHTMGERKLALDIFYSGKKKSGGHPAILLIHGGGWRSGDRSQCIPIAQQLANRGYVTAAVEYRLSPESKYPAAVHDLKAAIRWMRTNARHYNIDAEKIAVMGFSSGGQLAALLGTTNFYKNFEDGNDPTKTSSAVQAIVDVDGILAFKHPESAEGAVAAAWLGGTYDQNPAAWQEASALTHADKNTPPILFINSALPRFHAGRNDMIKKLDSLKVYTEVHELPNTPHPFWLFNPWFETTTNLTAAFLQKVFEYKRERK